jgi:hypothetical protein
MITNIYNKKTKGPTLMEFFTAMGFLPGDLMYTAGQTSCDYHREMNI